MVTYPKDWKTVKIGELFDVFAGGDLKKESFSKLQSSKYPYKIFSNGVENLGLYGFTSHPVFPGDSLTVTARGTIGKAYYRKKPFDAIIRLLVLIPKTKTIKPKLYEYYINHYVKFELENTGVPQLTAPKIKSKYVPYFNTAEQDNILSCLYCFDSHIDNLSALIEKKKMIRDGALEDLVTGKTRLAGFNGGWKKVSFDEVITPKARIGWQGLKKDEYQKYGYSYLIGGINFENGKIKQDELFSVSRERYDLDPYIQVKENDVLVTKDGTIGKVARVPKLDKPATLNSGVFVFRTSERLCKDFLFTILISSIFKGFIDTLSAGSTIKHLYQKDLKKFSFDIPESVEEQNAIATTIEKMDEEIEALESEKTKMMDIREGIMDDLLTGRVRLKI